MESRRRSSEDVSSVPPGSVLSSSNSQRQKHVLEENEGTQTPMPAKPLDNFTLSWLLRTEAPAKLAKEKKKPITGASPQVPEWPQTREAFLGWFWKGTNGNDLVKELNRSPSHGDNYIRREKDRPTVYGIVLNNDQLTPEANVWKLCKVGFTQVPTAEGTNNRMEQLKKEIDRKYKDKTEGREANASVLFVLPIGAVDTTPYLIQRKEYERRLDCP
ncbi:hypothetical protein OS493_034244 [Desmophyllum pertusum]|uniref:Uncharacterized protein n=1 Tax=Desmophyllum pertusum TaxID=174260 RepID=A0A9W9Z9G6_9CNID|nr:hypothetical protein OS493_034244 [Desmophyllum pertusum]